MTRPTMMTALLLAPVLALSSVAAAGIIDVPAGEPTIQQAIGASSDGDEIVVAPGVYMEAINLQGKAITVRSADGAAVTTIDATGQAVSGVRAVNGEGPATWLVGFTVTGADNDGPGGGMNIFGASPTIIGCVFTGNTATIGGGLHNVDASPLIIGCSFVANTSTHGAGLGNRNSHPTIIGCRFVDNVAADKGGGMRCHDGAHPLIVNSLFHGNVAVTGGGIHLMQASNPQLAGCTLVENTATADGGGLYLEQASSPTVRNTILWDNVASGGAGLAAQIHIDSGVPIVDYCCITGSDGSLGGQGNIGSDPDFVDAAAGDFRLDIGSPCTDAGHNNAVPLDSKDLDEDGDTVERTPIDLDGAARFAADAFDFDPGCGVPVVVDMGAYEHAGGAATVRAGDQDGDAAVGTVDLLALLGAWGPCDPGCCLLDLDLDGAVATADLLALLAAWGVSP